MKVKVYAKLNLTLNVLGKQNGFHNIDSLISTVDIYDVVTVEKRADRQVTVAGLSNVPTEFNTAYRAACGFIGRFGTSGVDVSIEKHIPLGAGMGGSSADAAAVIYCMSKLYGIDVDCAEAHALCASIGSDVSFMLHGGLGRLQGKGDDIVFGSLGSPLYFALTTFDTSMSTAEVYAQFDKLGSDIDLEYVDTSALMDVLRRGGINNAVSECFNNHLQAATLGLSDYACDYLRFCDEHGLYPNMTGSGSVYYVAFVCEQSARDAVDLLNAYGFDTTECKSLPFGIEII